MKHILRLLIITLIFSACSQPKKSEESKQNIDMIKQLSDAAKKVRDYMGDNVVIAHRGTTFWAPEETEPAYRWARNIGADYLEIDVQLTKDEILVAFHDNDLKRTTNIKDVFPDRADGAINDFTLIELRSLDVGTWFNAKFSDRARAAYTGATIMTLQDIVMIAEGQRIVRENGVAAKEIIDNEWSGKYLYEIDPKDNGNRPGIYIETKNPKLNIESVLAKELSTLGWNINQSPKEIKTKEGKTAVANTDARLILQSFSPESILQLENHLPNVPKCLLLWQPEMVDDLKGNYKKAIEFSIANNVHSMGTSIAGEPNNYKELTAPWMADMIHDAGMVIHPYTFDTNEQLAEYKDRVEGVFTNRADLALAFYGRASAVSSEGVLDDLGY